MKLRFKENLTFVDFLKPRRWVATFSYLIFRIRLAYKFYKLDRENAKFLKNITQTR